MDGEYDFWMLDLDGTLVDVEDAYITGVIEDVGDRLGVSFSTVETRGLWYGTGDRRSEVLAAAGVDPGRFWDVFHDVEDAYARAEATRLYPDAAAFVPELSVPVGLVTHCQPYLTEPVLETLDIGDWFDTVVCCTEETGWKPDPRPVELAMGNLGVGHNGDAGALAGDALSDVAAARNAGLSSVHVRRDHTGECIDSDACVPRLTDLR